MSLNNSSLSIFDSKLIILQTPGYYKFIIKYFLPVSIPAGLFTTLLTLVLLPSQNIKINNQCRYLYLFYIVSEFFLIFFKEVQDGLLSDGLVWLSEGKIFLSLETSSSLFCKIFRGCRFSIEVLATYSITIMNFERFPQIL